MLENVLAEATKENIGEDPDRQSSCSAVAGWLLRRLGPLKVVEIGTSYGKQLKTFLPYISSAVCVDPMYEWVPNVQDVEGFEPERVCQAKVDEWRRNAEPWKDRVELVIANSFRVHRDPEVRSKLAGAQVLIIDGCHHPVDSVKADYENFSQFMTSPHYIIWDDINLDDVRKAAEHFSDKPWVDVIGARLMYG